MKRLLVMPFLVLPLLAFVPAAEGQVFEGPGSQCAADNSAFDPAVVHTLDVQEEHWYDASFTGVDRTIRFATSHFAGVGLTLYRWNDVDGTCTQVADKTCGLTQEIIFLEPCSAEVFTVSGDEYRLQLRGPLSGEARDYLLTWTPAIPE